MLTKKEIEKMKDTQRFLKESLAPLIKQEILTGLSAATIEVTRKTLTEMMKDVSNQRGYFFRPEVAQKLGESNCLDAITFYTYEMNALGKLIQEFRNAKPNPIALTGPYNKLVTIPALLGTILEAIKKFKSPE